VSEALIVLSYILIPVLATLFIPLTSWGLGRWYQGRLLKVLDGKEKQQGSLLKSNKSLSTSSPMATMNASSSTLLHVSICVGPSWGQMFFMWVKSLFGGRLHSYDTVLDFGRREVLMRLHQQANELGCASIVNIRIETSVISFAKNDKSKQSSVEFLAFATGLRQ
jgi:uncharacterized protein YbjQ (UPF0145 family)